MNRVMREEKKFLISQQEFLKKRHTLEQIMRQDPHNGEQGYMVRSLYFDTPFDDDYYEKVEGIETRRKIRLRCYDPGQDHAMLELKQKQGKYQLKRSLKIRREEAERMIRGDLSFLLTYPESFAAEMYGLMNLKCYRPKAVVQYDRTAFIARENKIRVTFDRNIQGTETCFDLFSEQLNMNPVLDPADVVLEVKYNGFLLSYIKDLISSIDRSTRSVSKYCLARRDSCGRLF